MCHSQLSERSMVQLSVYLQGHKLPVERLLCEAFEPVEVGNLLPVMCIIQRVGSWGFPEVSGPDKKASYGCL